MLLHSNDIGYLHFLFFLFLFLFYIYFLDPLVNNLLFYSYSAGWFKLIINLVRVYLRFNWIFGSSVQLVGTRSPLIFYDQNWCLINVQYSARVNCGGAGAHAGCFLTDSPILDCFADIVFWGIILMGTFSCRVAEECVSAPDVAGHLEEFFSSLSQYLFQVLWLLTTRCCCSSEYCCCCCGYSVTPRYFYFLNHSWFYVCMLLFGG